MRKSDILGDVSSGKSHFKTFMKILAIETSCDETAIALIEASGGLKAPKFKIVKNLVTSQIEIHRPWGGVVPNLAKREHVKNLPICYRQILNDQFLIPNFQSSSNLKTKSFGPRPISTQGRWASGPSLGRTKLKADLLAVTVGPGLEPALWAGIVFAKQVWQEIKDQNSKIKIIGVNHLEGHLYSFLLQEKTGISNYQLPISKLFPAIALIVSGGHTILLRVDSLTKWKKLGETRDDAVGEAFDKVAKMLGLPYPGGPEIEKAAEKGNPSAIPFPRPMLHSKDYDFSFSGLKTAVLYYIRDHKLKADSFGPRPISTQGRWASGPSLGWTKLRADIAASFQQAAVDVLTAKTARAVREFGAKSILLSGGVAANAALRSALKAQGLKLKVHFLVPPIHFNTDNATMIAAAAYIQHLRKKKYPLRANGTLNL